MDSEQTKPLNLNLQTPPQNESPKKSPRGLALVGVGIIEVLFVSLVIFILLAVLNYFNVLSISDLSPKYLGWLPRQVQNLGQNQISVTPPSPTPNSFTPAPDFAINDTRNLINDMILPSFIPSDLKFEKQNVENPNEFVFYGTYWTTEDKEGFVSSVEYNTTNTIIDRQITIHIPPIKGVLDPSVSLELVKKYFKIIPSSSFKCIDLPTQNSSKFCEAFWIDEDVKKGINLTSPVYGLNETRIFYCEHHKGTPAYEWLSCSVNYKDTGI